MTTTFYQMAINNTASHINSPANRAKVLGTDLTEAPMTAFQVSEVLAIVFCKNKEEILQDILNTAKNL